MRNVRSITLLGVFLLLALSACDATDLARLQDGGVELEIEGNQVEFTGTLEALDETNLTVEGQLLSIVPESEIAPNLVVGDIVKVEAVLLEDGSLVALEVKPLDDSEDDSGDDDDRSDDEIEFTGEISAMEDGLWTIGGQQVAILATTEIHGQFAVGDIVKVHAFLAEDGTLTAREIEASDGSEMDDFGDSDEDGFELTGSVEAISDTEWTIAGVMVTIDALTDINPGIGVGDWVKAKGMVLEDGTFLAVEIKLEELSDDDSAKLEFVGVVEAIGSESWTVAGRVVPITSDTEIEDGIEVGDMVKVELRLTGDGTLVAREIEFYDDDGMDLDHDDDDDDDEDDDDHDDDHDDSHDDDEEDDHEDDD